MSGNLHFGKTYGMLTVVKDWIAFHPLTNARYRACKCRCECGTVIPQIDYKKVKTLKHCGCLRKVK